jgi:hypothetical protein
MAPGIQPTYSRAVQILKQLDAGTGGAITVIYQPGVVTPWDRTATLRWDGFITDLRATISVPSFPETDLPNLDATSGRTARITAVRDQEWKSERCELDLLMKTAQTGWIRISTLSVINRPPFFVVNLAPYLTDQVSSTIAPDAVLAVQLRDVGFGYLKGADTISIFGAVREQSIPVPNDGYEIIASSETTLTIADTTVVALAANPARKAATLINASPDRTIYLSYNPVAQLNRGIQINPNGGAFNIDSTNLFKGAIAAVADGPGATLLVSEGW